MLRPPLSPQKGLDRLEERPCHPNITLPAPHPSLLEEGMRQTPGTRQEVEPCLAGIPGTSLAGWGVRIPAWETGPGEAGAGLGLSP